MPFHIVLHVILPPSLALLAERTFRKKKKEKGNRYEEAYCVKFDTFLSRIQK